MSNLNKIGIRVAPFSNRIVLARFGKDQNVALDTRDCMNEFLHALVQYVGAGNAIDFGGGDEQFTVTLVRKSFESGANAAANSPALCTEASPTRTGNPTEIGHD